MARYEKQVWLDHIVDEETGEIIQQGTVHSQQRMNHIEEGIYQSADKKSVDLLQKQVDEISDDLSFKQDKILKDITTSKKYEFEIDNNRVFLKEV